MTINRKQAIATLAGSLAVLQTSQGAVAANEVVRIGGTLSDPGLGAIYADQSGFPKQVGLDFDVENHTNGAAAIAALVGGSIDVTISNWITILQAREKGVPVVVVAPAVIYTSKEPTSSMKDLNSKTIAIDGLGNLTQLGVMAWIVKGGGDVKSIRFVEMPFADMPQALASHRVDVCIITEPLATQAKNAGRIIGAPYCAIASEVPSSAWVSSATWVENRDRATRFANTMYKIAKWASQRVDATLITEPLATQAKSAGRVIGYPYAAIAPVFPSSAWVANTTWAANRYLASRFAKAMSKTAQWANANRPATAAILAQRSKLDRTIIQSMHRALYSERDEAKLLLPLIDIALRYGAIKIPVNIGDVYAASV